MRVNCSIVGGAAALRVRVGCWRTCAAGVCREKKMWSSGGSQLPALQPPSVPYSSATPSYGYIIAS